MLRSIGLTVNVNDFCIGAAEGVRGSSVCCFWLEIWRSGLSLSSVLTINDIPNILF